MAEESPANTPPEINVYSGVRWTAISAWGQQVVQFGIGIVLARLLTPQDYGLLAMAAVFIGFLAIFKYMGFHTAIIQRREVSDDLLSSVHYFVIAVSGVLFVATVAVSPLLAWCYREPRVLSVTAVLGFNFLLSAPGLMPFAILNRQMKFDRIAVVDMTCLVIGGATSVAMALAGTGVWALVTGSIAGTAASTIMYRFLSQWRPRQIFLWSEIRSVIGFGANITGFNIFNYFARNADNLIIGMFLGAGPLGFYSQAYGIMLKPRDTVTNVLMQVLFPVFSRMQDDDTRLRLAYLRSCGAIAFVTFPMMLGLLSVAHPFVVVVLSDKWLPAVPLICIFAPLGMVQSVWSTAGQLFLAKGRADWQLRWGVFAGTVIMASFLIGVQWGALGVAISYAIACSILLLPGFYIPFSLVDGLRLRDLAAALAPHIVSSGTMALTVICFRAGLPLLAIRDDSVLGLGLSVFVGVVTYILLVLLIRPVALKDLTRLLPRVSFMPLGRFARDGQVATDSDTMQKPGLLSDTIP